MKCDLSQFLSSQEQILIDADERIKAHVEDLTERVLANAVSLSPHGESGTLRGSWEILPLQQASNGYESGVVNTCGYATYVNKKQQFLERAAEQALKEVIKK